MAAVLAGSATGCGESGTLIVVNNWPVVLFPVTPALAIDGIFVLDSNATTPLELISAQYNYLGPSDTLLPTQSRSIFLLPGVYDFFVTAPSLDYVDCTMVFTEENIALANTGHHTFEITDTTPFFLVGTGCPTAEP